MKWADEVAVEALRLLAEGGCSSREVGRRLGVPDVTVSRWARVAGMQLKKHTGGLARAWPPVLDDSMRLCLAQRILIGCRLGDGCSLRAIAREIGVAPSTVSREVGLGQRDGRYDPGWSQMRAEQARRRPRASKLAPGTRLRRVVVEGLNARFSPQQIAGRLRCHAGSGDDLSVSTETIYQALYLQGKGALRQELKVAKALRSGRVHRRPQSRLPARSTKPWLAEARICQRPAEVADRAVPGHWEGDLVVGPFGRTALITLVERSSRFCLISRLPGLHDSETVIDRLTVMVAGLPAALLRTLTWDQGPEMAQHRRFTVATSCPVYFCDPHSPWQRGSNENLNGLVRDFYPKGTSFADVTDVEVAQMQQLLNTRPRKTLDYQTPAEKLDQLIAVAMTT